MNNKTTVKVMAPLFKNMSKSMLPLILTIENKAYPIPWSEQQFNDCLKQQYFCQVVTINNIIVGYYIVQIILDEFHLLNLCISPEFQQNGLGQCLLQNICDHANSSAINRILLEVRWSNKIAKKLYLKTGFHIIGKRKNYYPALPHQPSNNEITATHREDAVVMELALP